MTSLALFLAAAAVVLVVGPRMARTAEGLATATGLGGGLFGVVFLALATDLPEVALTPTAVLRGHTDVAVGGLLGAAAAQLTLIAVLDIVLRGGRIYGRATLLTTLGQCSLLLAVASVPLLTAASEVTFGGIGLATFLIPPVYLAVLAGIRRIGREGTDGRAADQLPLPIEGARPSRATLWRRFAVQAALLAGAGVGLEHSAEAIGSTLGISGTAAGAVLAGIVTPLPELVTSLSAARAGAIDLAVGGLVGSSALDISLLSLADVVHTEGSVFQLLGGPELVLLGMSIAITALLGLGVARRDVPYTRRVGLESYAMVLVYIAGAAILVMSDGGGG